MNRKERILQYLRENTQRFVASGFSRPDGLETTDIARELHLDRANVSKLLNELWNAGQAVKIQGRPTLYLSYRVLELSLPGQFIPNTVTQIEELLHPHGAEDPPELPPEVQSKPSPVWDSLRPLIQEALSVCSYPPYGLPLLLVSPSQEDAEVLVRQLFAQLKANRPAGARLTTIDCRGSLQGDSSFFQRLFGCAREMSSSGRGTRSSFELSAHGMVFLVGVHRLPEYVLEQLLTAIDRRTYCRMGETASRPLDTTLVLSLPPQNNGELLARLNKHIPCVLTVPSLDSRSVDEKLELLIDLLSQEAFALGQTLRLNKAVLAYLLAARYPAGVSELRGMVRLLCSAVLRNYRSDKEASLSIECRCLPQRVIADAESQLTRLQHIFDLLSMIPNDYLFFTPDGSNETLRFLQSLWQRGGSLDILPDDAVFSPSKNRLAWPEQYIKNLLEYLNSCDGAKIARLQKAVPHYILQSAARRLARSPEAPEQEIKPALLLGLLLPMLTISLREVHWELPANALAAPGGRDAALCRELFEMFSPRDRFALSPEEEAFFAAYLAAARQYTRTKQVSVLILCHGKSIASEYASILRQYGPPGLSAAGVDVALEETLAETTRRAAELAKALDQGGGIALVADMPPLLSLATVISRQAGVPCRGVGEVSLSALLHLSDQCVAGRKLSELVYRAPIAGQDFDLSDQDDFMRRYFGEVFAPNLTFLDLSKAISTLSAALTGILEDLHIPYSHEVAIKFFSHGSYMLERVISGRVMNFPNLRRFLAENRRTVSVVERRLEPVSNTFGITIPAAEIAYIVEVFGEYTND